MKYIEQYDEASGYTFEIPELELMPGLEMKDALARLAPEIHEAMVSALYHGINFDCEQVPVFAIKGSDLVMNLSCDEYRDRLESTLAYFQSIEEYEVCQALIEIKSYL